jgi:Ribbon-helix-helix protein, copG family
MAKKKQRGGKREGAGRPIGPDGPTELVGVTVPKSLMKDLDRLCKAEGWKRSQAVTEAIRGLLKRKSGA